MEECKTEVKKTSWYNHPDFPLIPQFGYSLPEDDWNTSSWYFNWLGFKLWDLDHFAFEISLNIDTHWGIAVCAIVPYNRIIVGIPCPWVIEKWVNKHLVRKSKGLKELQSNN